MEDSKQIGICKFRTEDHSRLNLHFQFYPYPSYGTFTIAGESFDLMDGVFGLALTPKKSPDDRSNTLTGSFNRQTERALYFHSLASGHENVVPLRVVNNASIWEANANAEPRAFGELGRRGIQASGESMDIATTIIDNNLNCASKNSSSDGQQWKFVFRADESAGARLLGQLTSIHPRKHQNCYPE